MEEHSDSSEAVIGDSEDIWHLDSIDGHITSEIPSGDWESLPSTRERKLLDVQLELRVSYSEITIN